ncbi:MAG: nucleotidyltransferase domain-containing protein [Armatimonadota bacterium]
MTRIFRIDGEAVRARLREWAHSLGQSDANVLGVVLFGSFARGGYTAASDADILVILQESPYRIDERIPLYRPRQLGVRQMCFLTRWKRRNKASGNAGACARRDLGRRGAVLRMLFSARPAGGR